MHQIYSGLKGPLIRPFLFTERYCLMFIFSPFDGMQCLPRIDLFTGNMSLNCDQLSQMFIFIFIVIVHFDTVIPLLQISHCVTGDVADTRVRKGTGKRKLFLRVSFTVGKKKDGPHGGEQRK